jgi:DNA replication protein DnaC
MIEEITEKCNTLKLGAFTAHLQEALTYAQEKNWSHQKVLLHLLNLETERRKQSRIDLRFRQSKLNEKITIDQFDFTYHKSRKNYNNTILNLTTSEFVYHKKDVTVHRLLILI